MEDWLRVGRRIKADWVGMLEGMASRSREPVKIPFVPLAVSGVALRAVLEDVLPAILGPNPSLLTVILDDGRPIKAYAEDARPGGPTGGVYEELVPLPLEPEAGEESTREDVVRLARSAGFEPGVVKEAETGFFELFTEEPEDLIGALALLASEGARALREGLIRFDPPVPAAELAKLLRIGRDDLAWILSRLLPEGRYGLGLSCTAGAGGLVLDVERAAEGDDRVWRVREVEAKASGVSGLALELLDREGCGVAVALRLPAVAGMIRGDVPFAEFLRGGGLHWDVRTRSGLEGLAAAVSRVTGLLGIERDLAKCNVSFESLLALARDYAEAAVRYARDKGLALKLTDPGAATSGPRQLSRPGAGAGDSMTVVVDAEGVTGVMSEGRGGAAPELDAGAPEGAAPGGEELELDLSLVRRGVSLVSSDPFAGLRELVPLDVLNAVSYSTAVVLVHCRRPEGRLLLFGGPHQFFNRSWEGDACAVFIAEDGRAPVPVRVREFPSMPLVVERAGRRVALEADGVAVDLHFQQARWWRDQHGAGRLVGETKLADWLPGLEVARGLYRLTSGSAEFDGRGLEVDWGWMYLEEGRGRLLRWPFGSTWHYVSWLFPAGECGSGVHAAPMLGQSTPKWWRRLLEATVDGAHRLSTGTASPGGELESFETAVEPGPPARVVRHAARVGDVELSYRVLSAALVPFDEEGQMILRLRCLCDTARDGYGGTGVGLVEIPASLPGAPRGACECQVVFTESGVSCRAMGREVLLIESGSSGFLSPYFRDEPGALHRMARRIGSVFGFGE